MAPRRRRGKRRAGSTIRPRSRACRRARAHGGCGSRARACPQVRGARARLRSMAPPQLLRPGFPASAAPPAPSGASLKNWNKIRASSCTATKSAVADGDDELLGRHGIQAPCGPCPGSREARRRARSRSARPRPAPRTPVHEPLHEGIARLRVEGTRAKRRGLVREGSCNRREPIDMLATLRYPDKRVGGPGRRWSVALAASALLPSALLLVGTRRMCASLPRLPEVSKGTSA